MKIFSFLACTLVPFIAISQNQPSLNNDIALVKPNVIEWRRFLHKNPELSNREFKTAAFIASHLKSWGLEVRTGIAKTGVVGILKGGKPGPVVALRADIDALPVHERTDVSFRSTDSAEYMGQKVPVMHACGHDSHIAMLLGTAEVLSKEKNNVPGTVIFIFQPAEEGPPANEEGGAPLMIKEGVMDHPRVEAIFGMHINAQTEIGKIKYTPGAAMASSDWFTIKVHGKSSHGSEPWLGVDPIVVATQIIEGFQTIVSRQEMLTKAPVVISVGKISGGSRSNIIPEEVTMDGTIRTLDSKMQRQVHDKMRLMATKIAEASGATVDIIIDTKTEVTFNNRELVRKMLPSLESAAGKDNVIETNWTTQAEDFSYFGNKAPAFYFFMGGMPLGADPSKAAPHHTPDFYIDDSRLDLGVKVFCQLVYDYAKVKS